MGMSVVPTWCTDLSLQQQGVLLLAGRGPDGVEKFNDCKGVVRAYRACIFISARVGRGAYIGEDLDTFSGLDGMADWEIWVKTCDRYYSYVDALPHHYHLHLLHGAQVLGYKHPETYIRMAWMYFYERGVEDMHLSPESEVDMDNRLSDWHREAWV